MVRRDGSAPLSRYPITGVQTHARTFFSALSYFFVLCSFDSLILPDSELMKKLTVCAGVFSHSAVYNDMLNELQKLEEDLHHIYELIRRNDTR